jgi:cell shape-determining protein MreC
VLEKLMDISVLRNENERLKEQLARTQAASGRIGRHWVTGQAEPASI